MSNRNNVITLHPHPALIIALALFLTACNSIHSGAIEHKNYEPAYSYTTTQPVQAGKTTTYIPIVHYVPERFSFTIRGKDEDGKEGTNTITVPAVTYGQYEVGDWYPKRNQGGEIK